MIINRHNYEEFFLLCVDKELSAEERAAVEAFVGQNPDLAKELAVLQQTTLVDENVQFKQKDLLYKKGSSISLANYEEYFLLFGDGELNQEQLAEVEHFVLMHPQLQDEFTLLQKARLEPEMIAFAGKEKLYRKAKDQRRIIILSLARMGVAAAVAGIVYLSFILIQDNKNNLSHPSIVGTHPVHQGTEKGEKALTQTNRPEKAVPSSSFKEESKKEVEKIAVISRKNKKGLPRKIKGIKEEEKVLNKENNSKAATLIEDQSLAITETAVPKNQAIEEDVLKKFNDNSINNEDEDDAKDKVMISYPAKEEKPLVTRAVYLETDNAEEEKVVYVGTAPINKNKLKGLLRKAAVFFDKKVRGSDN